MLKKQENDEGLQTKHDWIKTDPKRGVGTLGVRINLGTKVSIGVAYVILDVWSLILLTK